MVSATSTPAADADSSAQSTVQEAPSPVSSQFGHTTVLAINTVPKRRVHGHVAAGANTRPRLGSPVQVPLSGAGPCSGSLQQRRSLCAVCAVLKFSVLSTYCTGALEGG